MARLENELEFLREECRPKDTIMSLTQRIPELKPAREPRDGPETASEEPGESEAPLEKEQHYSWWRRLFGSNQ